MKKNHSVVFTIALFSILFVACKEDNQNGNMGNNIKPFNDSIFVQTDTFHLHTSNLFVESVFLQNDTFPLGEVYDSKYGTTKADLLFQVAPPLKYIFPSTDSESVKNAKPDSLVLYIHYKTWFGSSKSPFEIALYEMNKKTLSYSDQYFSNIDISEYTDANETVLIGKRILTSIDQSKSDTLSTPSIRYKLKDEYAKLFFELPKSAFESESNFLQHFKGIYLTTDYGSSTMLYVKQIDLRLFYHYTRIYEVDGVKQSNEVSTWVNFPVNRDVRQVNRFQHPDANSVKTALQTIDSVNYMKAPAGIYVNVTVPLKRMSDRIKQKIGKKWLTLNNAVLTMQATEQVKSKMAIPAPDYLLLLRKDKLQDYFLNKNLPTGKDSTAVIGYYDAYKKEYKFDISYLLSKSLRENNEEFLEMVAVPIDANLKVAEGNGSYQTYITSVKPLFKMAATTLRSGKNKTSPMKIELLYSGF